MLLHRSFTLTKDNKSSRVSQDMNPEFGNELQRGYSERKNETTYNEHQNINA
jgi:hypothetical protein